MFIFINTNKHHFPSRVSLGESLGRGKSTSCVGGSGWSRGMVWSGKSSKFIQGSLPGIFPGWESEPKRCRNFSIPGCLRCHCRSQPWLRIPSQFRAPSLCPFPFSGLGGAAPIPSRAVPFPWNCPWSRGCTVPSSQQSFPGAWICLPAQPQLPLDSRWEQGPGKAPGTFQSRRSSIEAEQIQHNQKRGFSGPWRHSSTFYTCDQVRMGQVESAVTGVVSNQQIPIFCTLCNSFCISV